MVERVVRRPVNAFERFVSQLAFFHVVVDVMIANHVVPGNSQQRDGPVEGAHGVEIVEGNVAQCDSKRCFGSDEFLDDIVRDPVNFFLVARLGVAEHDGFELIRFADLVHGEVHRRRQWAGWFDSFEVQLRRSIRFVNVVEPGQHLAVEWRSVPAGFDDKQNRVVIDGQFVPSGRVGCRDVFSIRHADSGQSSFACVWLLVGVGVFEDAANGEFGLSDRILSGGRRCQTKPGNQQQ